MAEHKASSGRAAQTPPRSAQLPAEDSGSGGDVEKSFSDHFGEPQGLQERVVSDSTAIVYRDGVTVMTDAPREGDVPQSAVPGHSAQRTRQSDSD